MGKKAGIKARATIEQWQGPIYGYALRWLRSDAEASDATQEIFLKILKDLPKLRSEDAIRPWIFKLATRVLIDFKRQRDRRREVERSAASPDEAPAEENRMEQHERSRLIGRQVAELPERCRSALILKYYQGLTQREVAEALGLPRSTVASQIQKALGLLRERLAPAGILTVIPDLEAELASGARPQLPEALSQSLRRLADAAESAPGEGSNRLVNMAVGALLLLLTGLVASCFSLETREAENIDPQALAAVFKKARVELAKTDRQLKSVVDILDVGPVPGKLELGPTTRVGYAIEKIGFAGISSRLAVVAEDDDFWFVEQRGSMFASQLGLTVRKSDGLVMTAFSGRPGGPTRAVEPEPIPRLMPAEAPASQDVSLTFKSPVGGPHKARIIQHGEGEIALGTAGALEDIPLRLSRGGEIMELKALPEDRKIDIGGEGVEVKVLDFGPNLRLWITKHPVIVALTPPDGRFGAYAFAAAFQEDRSHKVTKIETDCRPALTWP